MPAGGEGAVLVLQHIACEPPAAYADELAARQIRTETVHLDRLEDDARLPDWRQYAAIVAMGGPMGACDDAVHAWLSAEKALIREAVCAGLPYWGVCLGAQLLAAVLGAPVFAGSAPEIGVLPVTLAGPARSDPVFCTAPAKFDALHWHGDTYALPRGATQLARSAQYEQQAFVFGRAYGVQFHLEVSAALARDWAAVPAYRESLERAHGAAALDALLDDVVGSEHQLNALARELFGRWIEQVVLRSSRPPAQNPTGLPLGTTSTEPRDESSAERARPLSATRPGAPG
jgi:GMP synthase-like glutamine amidotransferase